MFYFILFAWAIPSLLCLVWHFRDAWRQRTTVSRGEVILYTFVCFVPLFNVMVLARLTWQSAGPVIENWLDAPLVKPQVKPSDLE